MSLETNRANKLMRIKLADQPHVINHIELVTQKSLEIGRRLKERRFDVNLKLLETGGYLHDIGRSVTHGVGHAVESGKIIREFGFSEPVIRLVEKHVGAGITAEEAKKLGLPVKDYIPETLEEKILAYADKFVETKLVFETFNGEQVVCRRDIKYDTIEPTLNRFRKMFGSNSPVVLRLERLRDEVESLLKSKPLTF